MNKDDKRLIGIKAIADYLDMSVRNVYYWEKKLGLPLHRITSDSGYRIYAYKSELERWLKNKESSSFKRTVKRIGFPIAVIVPVGLALLFILLPLIGNKEVIPATISTDKNIVYLKDSNGKVIWQFSSKNNLSADDLKNLLDFKDIDKDNKKELIACTYDISMDDCFLVFFDCDKGVVWEKAISPEQTFDGSRYNNFLRPGPVRFARTHTGQVIIISQWNHRERFLAAIACHDLQGNLMHTYLHTGQLTPFMKLIDLDKDGIDEIIFTGTNNLLNGEGIIGVLPITGFDGVSPPRRIEPEYSHLAIRLKKYIADDTSPGNQLVYIRFKKTAHLSNYEEYFNCTEVAYFNDDAIQFRLYPWKKGTGLRAPFGFDYVFGLDFSLREVLEQERILNYFPSFLQNKDIDIPLKKLKEIYTGIVHRWEKGSWIPVKIHRVD